MGRRSRPGGWGIFLVALLLSAACTMVQPSSAPLGTEQNPVKLALAPDTDPQKVLTAGELLARLLEAATGLRIKLSVPTSYAATIEAMGTHNLDLGWLAPLAYVTAHERIGAEVLAANVKGGSTTSVGEIVVRADSGIADLEGLRGKKLVVADDASAASFYLPLALLEARGIESSTHFSETQILGADDRVLLAVYNRQADAGVIRSAGTAGVVGVSAVARTAFQPLPPDLGEQVRVIVRTDAIPNAVVGVRRDVPPDVGRKLRDGLLRVAASPAGLAALRELYGIEGLGSVTDAELNPLRADAAADGGGPPHPTMGPLSAARREHRLRRRHHGPNPLPLGD